MSSFTVVICHGSYHTPEPYQPFVEGLQRYGIEVYCPQLPSSDLTKLNIGDTSAPDYDREPPQGGYPQPSDDARLIKTLLERLIETEQKMVIVLGHSSGGFTATMASIPRFWAKNRRAKGEKGGVYGIFYACAFLVPKDESVHTFFQPKDGSPPTIPPYTQFYSRGIDGLASAKEAATYFFNDLDAAKAEYYASKLTASAVLQTPLDNDPYGQLPMTYLITENDMALPVSYQEAMIQQQVQSGAKIDILRCHSGHEPQLSWTEDMVKAVANFGKTVTFG